MHGHELLFRADPGATTAGTRLAGAEGDRATTTVILNTFTAFGLEQLVGDGLAFVNLTRPFIVGDLPVPFSSQVAVLELLESVVIDDEVAAGVRGLVAAGFAVALDDFLWDQADRASLLEHVSYVKVDISQVPRDELASTVARLRRHDVRLVAERVETAEDLSTCRDLGFDLFQGYHLLRPETLSAVALNPDHLACLDLLRRLSDPRLTMEGVEALVRRDAALTYRVLHAANAAATGLRRRLTSVREALVLLGTERLRAWVMLLVASDAGDGGEEQLVTAVVRARMCELLARRRRVAPEVAFTAGLVSRLDVVLGVPLADVLERLALSDDLQDALLRRTGPIAGLLTAVEDYEVGDTALPELTEAYVSAVAWATRTVAEIPEPDRSGT